MKCLSQRSSYEDGIKKNLKFSPGVRQPETLVCLIRSYSLCLLLTGGHDQSEPGGYQTLDYSASDRDSGV